MKCPKCGSTNKKNEDVLATSMIYQCIDCKNYFEEARPTTAEKLLYVVKKCIEKQGSIFITDKVISICTPLKGFEILCNEEKFSLEKGLEEAIQQAYMWAKEQKNAVNSKESKK